jgi:hypothetical protein
VVSAGVGTACCSACGPVAYSEGRVMSTAAPSAGTAAAAAAGGCCAVLLRPVLRVSVIGDAGVGCTAAGSSSSAFVCAGK